MGMSRKTFTDVEDDAHSNPDGESADDAALRWMIRAKTEQRRALKAEKERDHLATVLETTARQRDEADKRNALPLTPDAITDEMIERARTAWNRSSALGNDLWRDVLAAALTEPPKRPEGAEDWEDWLIEAMPHESMPDEDIALLADRIAQRLNEERS